MKEIDVTKCIYYNHKMCDASTVCYDGEESKEECEFCKDDCYYVQLQRFKAERDLLLSQLVILDGEDVTVQITQEQFEEYNKLKAENESLQSLNDFNVQKIETLEVENEELRKYIDRAGIIGIIKIFKCLDEIERMINDFCSDCIADCTRQDSCITYKIMRKLKEVKENV